MTKQLWHLRFLAKKPGIVPRLIKDLWDVRVRGRNRLRTVDLAITYRCNARCQWCSAHKMIANKRNRDREELSPREIGDLWSQAKRLGAIHVNLTGGEPTVRPYSELTTIIASLDPEHTLVSMVTNSTNLRYCDLAGYRRVGLDTLQLSIESLDATKHDAIRRSPGNLEKLLTVLGWALELGLNVCLSTVVTADNFDNAREIAAFARDKGAFCLLNPISASGANADNAVARGIRDKKDEYYRLLNSSGHIRADTVVNFRGGPGCPAGVERIAITPYGDVMTCPHVQVSYGNIRMEPLAAIYERISTDSWLCDFERDCRHVFNDAYIEARLKPTWGLEDLPIPIEELRTRRGE